MADSVILNKVASIERCIQRVKEDYVGYEADFETNFMRQDAVILNLQRACELSIDLANHLVKIKQLGIPQNSRQGFELLLEAKIIDKGLARELSAIWRLMGKCSATSLMVKATLASTSRWKISRRVGSPMALKIRSLLLFDIFFLQAFFQFAQAVGPKAFVP